MTSCGSDGLAQPIRKRVNYFAMSEEEFEWDADDFDPDAGFVKKEDKWEGEDQDLKLSETKELVVKEKAVQQAPKKSKKEIIEEKRAKRKAEELDKLEKEKESLVKSTEEKLRLQQVQREADLEITKELFDTASSFGLTIDSMNPVTQDEFDVFGEALKEKLKSLAASPIFLPFMDKLLRDTCAGMDVDEMRKLGNTMNFMANEKQKVAKSAKGKKKKATLGVTGKAAKRADMNTFDDYGNDDLGAEFDDFM